MNETVSPIAQALRIATRALIDILADMESTAPKYRAQESIDQARDALSRVATLCDSFTDAGENITAAHQEAREAWATLISSTVTVDRLGRYDRPNQAMRDDRYRAMVRRDEATAILNRYFREGSEHERTE